MVIAKERYHPWNVVSNDFLHARTRTNARCMLTANRMFAILCQYYPVTPALECCPISCALEGPERVVGGMQSAAGWGVSAKECGPRMLCGSGMQENVGMGGSVVGSSCSGVDLDCAQRVSEYLLSRSRDFGGGEKVGEGD